MATPRQVEANRKNARRSTGPRTSEGKAIVAANAVKTGLHATRHLVLASQGEATEEYDDHTTAVIADLVPIGPVETATANTIASLLWRLRRIPQYEAAAAQPPSDLPPSPDHVEPHCSHTLERPAPTAPVRERLARARYDVQYFTARRIRLDRALDRLRTRLRRYDSDTEHSIPEAPDLKEAANYVLGLQPIDPAPWQGLREALGWTAEPGQNPAMTASRFVEAFDHFARDSGRTPPAFRRALRKKLPALRERAEGRLAEAQASEESLVQEMQAERDRAAAVSLFASDCSITGIQKAEQHLTRQLERQLALIDRLQARRKPAVSPAHPRAAIGFVFQGGLPGLAASAGHPDRLLESRDLEPNAPDLGSRHTPRSAFEPAVLD